MKEKEQVILLHGIFDRGFRLKALENLLKAKGYKTLNIDYPSTKYSIEEIVDWLLPIIQKKVDQNRTVNFIGYSMGGLIARAFIHRYRPKKMGRLIQLASPNKGSEIADFLKDNFIFKKVFGPAGQQLITNQKQFKHIFGNVDYELGVIAGDLVLDPISALIMGKPSDGRVSVESTKIKGMKDHIVVKVGHKYFPHSRRVHKYALHFLQNGFFIKQS
jgi:pimeloyl-ACP methyl ester carboxylesterase